MRRYFSVLPVALLLLSATTAGAQQPSVQNKAAAQALFDEARELTRDGKHAEACPKYEESQRLDPSMGTLFYLAQCFENTGKLVSAWTYYREVADAARAAGQKDKEKFADDSAAALKPKLPRLVIQVDEAARQMAGLAIQRDGIPVGEAQWGTAIPLDLGMHTIAATAPKKKTWTTDVQVIREGQLAQVVIPPLAELPPPVDVVARLPSPLPAPPMPLGRIGGFVAGGVGLVALGVGAALGGVAIAKKNQSNDGGRCDASTDLCNDAGLALRSEAIRAATASTALVLVGIAALGAGAGLVLLTPAVQQPAAPPVPQLSVGLGSASLHWRW